MFATIKEALTIEQPTTNPSISYHKLILALAITAPFFIFIFDHFLLPHQDWLGAFWPALNQPLSPFNIKHYLNPLWVALLLSPLSVFLPQTGQANNAFLNLAVTVLVLSGYNGSWKSIFLSLTSAPFMILLNNGNIEWVPMLAFLFPNSWGILLFNE